LAAGLAELDELWLLLAVEEEDGEVAEAALVVDIVLLLVVLEVTVDADSTLELLLEDDGL